ncbi:sigma-E processing peptidase SpoIIGA [Bacillus sp. 03113]|uniref:sigma-E processing peptidase SpoIIGA n=1 Tax=Bacillus sp. 03113 TaxID=2578211 RepID=UPI001141B77A|nr:sigma-E processing peptidase SpoIIGA [Bacillus sp. 03113]
MIVYLDVIWVLNLLFDCFLLYLTAIILKRDIRIWRLLLGGLIGSLIILLAVTPYYIYTSHPISKLLFSVLMIFIVFGYKRLSYFIKGLITFYFTTFLVGGSLIGIHYFMKFDVNLSSSVLLASVKGFGDPISWLFVLLGFPAALLFTKRNIDAIEVTKIHYDQIVNISISMNGFTLQLKGLVDSGNQLYDPISKSPVTFVSLKSGYENVPEVIRRIAEDPDYLILGKNYDGASLEYNMRIIPYKVVGQDHQLIIAFKPDQIYIEQEDSFVEVEKGLISFTMQQLSSDDRFQCIVHPKMLSGKKVLKDVVS